VIFVSCLLGRGLWGHFARADQFGAPCLRAIAGLSHFRGRLVCTQGGNFISLPRNRGWPQGAAPSYAWDVGMWL